MKLFVKMRMLRKGGVESNVKSGKGNMRRGAGDAIGVSVLEYG